MILITIKSTSLQYHMLRNCLCSNNVPRKTPNMISTFKWTCLLLSTSHEYQYVLKNNK